MLTFHNLTLSYNRHPAVHHLNATVHGGELTALVGPNGAGKSTLLKAILGHIEPTEGRIEFTGIDRRDISYLPQASLVDRTFPMTVDQFVISGVWQQRGLRKSINNVDKEKAAVAIAQVGLEGFESRNIDALSGGQFQRMLFARKLIQNAKLLLLDEPFSGVDEETIEDLMRVLLAEHAKGATIVAVMHNLAIVREYFPKTLLLSRDLIDVGLTREVMNPDNLQRASAIGFGDPIHTEICDRHAHV